VLFLVPRDLRYAILGLVRGGVDCLFVLCGGCLFVCYCLVFLLGGFVVVVVFLFWLD
jgi:hypothetical protein